MKHSVANYKFAEKIEEDEKKLLNEENNENKDSDQIDSKQEKDKDNEGISDFSDGPEDKEAIMINEKNKIEETLRQSHQDFMKKASTPARSTISKADSTASATVSSNSTMPSVTRRLGVGLAAAVHKKLTESK